MKLPDHLLNKIESLTQELVLYGESLYVSPKAKLVVLGNKENFFDTFDDVKKTNLGNMDSCDTWRNGYTYTISISHGRNDHKYTANTTSTREGVHNEEAE